MSTNFPTALDTLTNPTATDYLNSPSHAGQHSDANDAIEALEAKVGINSSAVTTSHDYKITAIETISGNGWIPAGETWTYASADDPTFTFTISGDKTTKYQAGQRIKLTQTTDKYFIITKVSYSDPNTTITVYGGTDYDLANAAITSPYYSREKAPFGFPLDPTKWTVEVTDTTNRSQASPTQHTWYNIGSITISLPVGLWRVTASGLIGTDRNNAGYLSIMFTLSTANNSESDVDLTAAAYVNMDNSASIWYYSPVRIEKTLAITSKTSYYANIRTVESGVSNIYLAGANNKTIIRAVCAYL